MAEVAGTLFKHCQRLSKMATALARHGMAAWAAREGERDRRSSRSGDASDADARGHGGVDRRSDSGER